MLKCDKSKKGHFFDRVCGHQKLITKNSDIFHISAQNIDCLHRRGGVMLMDKSSFLIFWKAFSNDENHCLDIRMPT